jgi:hypothetical protein
MTKAVDEKDYKTFFEYRMDQYTRSGIVGSDTTKGIAIFWGTNHLLCLYYL